MFKSMRNRLLPHFGGDPALTRTDLRLKVRALTRRDADRYENHLLRLSDEDRRARFFAAMNDEAILRYTRGRDWNSSTILGAFVNDALRGAGEIAPMSDASRVELAVSVEGPYQNVALGRLLVAALLVEARLGHLTEARLVFLRENRTMLELARDLGARLTPQGGMIEGAVALDQRDPLPVRPRLSERPQDQSFPS